MPQLIMWAEKRITHHNTSLEAWSSLQYTYPLNVIFSKFRVIYNFDIDCSSSFMLCRKISVIVKSYLFSAC